MTNALTKALLEQQSSPLGVVPCVVTQVTPLLITLLGEANVSAVKVAGLTYSLANANALISKTGQPIVLPIG